MAYSDERSQDTGDTYDHYGADSRGHRVGHIDKPHTYAFVDDVTSGLATLAAKDGSVPRSVDRRYPAISCGSSDDFQPDAGEVAEILDQFEKPFVISHEKFESAFGAQTTPHQIAMRQTLAWYQLNSVGAP